MANLMLKERFAQKRGVSVGVFKLTEAEIVAAGNAVVANLPANSLVISSRVVPTVVSGTASSTISVDVGATTIQTNAAVTALTPVTSTTAFYFPTGGKIKVKPGTTAPAAGTLEVLVVVEYIELDKVNGEYTVIDS